MAADKARDPVLYLFEIIKCLRHTDNGAIHTHRMNHHGTRGHNEGIAGTDGDGHTYGMTAAQHQGYGGLAQRGQHLRYGQSRLHVSTHGI